MPQLPINGIHDKLFNILCIHIGHLMRPIEVLLTSAEGRLEGCMCWVALSDLITQIKVGTQLKYTIKSKYISTAITTSVHTILVYVFRIG